MKIGNWQVNEVCYFTKDGVVCCDVIKSYNDDTQICKMTNTEEDVKFSDLFKSQLDAYITIANNNNADHKDLGMLYKSAVGSGCSCNPERNQTTNTHNNISNDGHTSVNKGKNYANDVIGTEFIREACNYYKDFLIEKNKSYNGSAFKDITCLDGRKHSNTDTILIRIEDKLRRLQNRSYYPGDDDIKDLTGYLILLEAVKMFNNQW